MNIKNELIHLTQSTKAGGIVATGTTGLGLGTWLNMIPDEIGKLATLIGIIFSVVLIYTHLRKGHIDYKKTQLEIEILKRSQEVQQNGRSDEELLTP